MNDFNKIVEDIKSLKIQGAEHIAKSAVKSLKLVAEDSNTITKTKFLNELETAKKELFNARETEPCLRNALNFVLNGLDGDNLNILKSHLYQKINQALDHFAYAEEMISTICARKISDGMTIYTHCHSSTVINIFIEAKRQGKKFFVHNTETRPLFQGRKTATELSKLGIKVTHFIDSAARYAMKKSDMILVGADAITSDGKVINKIGSELFAEAASNLKIPFYVCSDSWKFDPMTIFGYEEPIEKRKSIEIWKNKPKNVTINNYAFEKINPNLITGIISEIGVFKPATFVEEIRRNNKWMF